MTAVFLVWWARHTALVLLFVARFFQALWALYMVVYHYRPILQKLVMSGKM